jgi:hypothetical protein
LNFQIISTKVDVQKYEFCSPRLDTAPGWLGIGMVERPAVWSALCGLVGRTELVWHKAGPQSLLQHYSWRRSPVLCREEKAFIEHSNLLC